VQKIPHKGVVSDPIPCNRGLASPKPTRTKKQELFGVKSSPMTALRKVIKLDIGFEGCTPATLAAMRESAFTALCGRVVTTRHGKSYKLKVLLESHARYAIGFFFNTMLSLTQDTVAGIVQEAPWYPWLYQFPTAELSIGDRDNILSSFKEVVRNLQALKEPPETIIAYIQRDIALVRLDEAWRTSFWEGRLGDDVGLKVSHVSYDESRHTKFPFLCLAHVTIITLVQTRLRICSGFTQACSG